MGKWEFYDYEEVEGADDQEPTFSFYDFKKWLESQNHDIPSFRESVDNKKREISDKEKTSLMEKFKQRMRERVQDNINRRLAERKKK